MSWGAQNRSEDTKTPSVGRGMSKKPEPDCCPVQPYQKSAIRIRNPYRILFSRAVVTGHFLWPGLFAIRKIRTSVNPHHKSVIRIMNP
jgi:hypothetical protein